MSKILAQQAIVEATSQLLVCELGGNNCGPEVARYLRSVGLDPGHKWCAAFVFCMYQDACVTLGKALHGPVFNPLHRTGSVEKMWQMAPVGLRTTRPTPGAVAIHLSPTGNHCAIFLAASPTHVATIDGNTNDDGGRDGDIVDVRRRPRSYWTGYIDITRALGDA